ncbi:MAG: hypothetical protein SF029_18395 [bacterium]|nr:hypothetical protein [bacterium]
MKNITRIALLVVIFALSGLSVALAHEGEHAAQQETAQTDAPAVTVDITAEGVVAPAEFAEGVNAVTFTNNSEAPSMPLIARLNEGETVDSFMGAMANGPMAALPLVSLLGGTNIEPGASLTINYALQPGEYIIVDFNAEMPAPATFTVADVEGEGAEGPAADVTVSLLDFAFSIPLEIQAGEKVWQVQNLGNQWHEMVIARVDEATAIGDYHDMLNAYMTAEDPEAAPFEDVAFWGPVNQGERAWFPVTLEPGTYVVICFLPDIMGEGHSHFQMGMVQLINVVE